MGLPETLLIVLGAAVLMDLVLGLLLRGALRVKAGSDEPQKPADMLAELEALKGTNAELGQKLAIEQPRASGKRRPGWKPVSRRRGRKLLA